MSAYDSLAQWYDGFTGDVALGSSWNLAANSTGTATILHRGTAE